MRWKSYVDVRLVGFMTEKINAACPRILELDKTGAARDLPRRKLKKWMEIKKKMYPEKRPERIKLEMTIQEIFLALAEGNPGAISVCAQLIKDDYTDPNNAFGGFGALLSLDARGIYGPRIWMFYKDFCKQSIPHMLACLRAYQLGQLAGVTEAALNHAIDNYGDGLDLDTIMMAVRRMLPRFNQVKTEADELKV